MQTGPSNKDSAILITGASGFIGPYLVAALLEQGFRNIRCLVRSSGNVNMLKEVAGDEIQFVVGNLLSVSDCKEACKGIEVIYHLAAGTGTKSYSEAFLHSVVSTRNLVEAALSVGHLQRLVSMSTFSVYTTSNGSRIVDENTPVEAEPHKRDAYCYAKAKQDELLKRYGRERNLPYVLVRPGVVYGPGKTAISGRVGLNFPGVFLHLGGSNPLPLTYVTNCADAVLLAGQTQAIEREVFNIVDDDLPSCRAFLIGYKKHVKPIRSIYLPGFLSYAMCLTWEKYAIWSEGQLPPVYTRREWRAYWKKCEYSNSKAKAVLGWSPRVPTQVGLKRFFESARRNA